MPPAGILLTSIGPGKISASAMAIPSCHEPDVYIAAQPNQYVALEGLAHESS